MEEVLPNFYEDYFAGKGDYSLQHYNFGTQIYFYASSNEDARSKISSGLRMGEIWKDSGVGLDKSQK